MKRMKLRAAIAALGGTALFGATGLAAAATPAADAQQGAANGTIEEVVVIGKAKPFANNSVTQEMLDQTPAITSINDVINNLPGVSVQEGDSYGFDDWSTSISIRGFQDSLDQQQIGMTIDGIPNGGSNYGGGSKANRFIDSANLGGVNVSQGTADIASRSNEALGGTLDFMTSDPHQTAGFTLQGSAGEYDGRRYYGRYDTGAFLNGTTTAWISASHQEATDWVNQSAQNQRDNYAVKFVTDLDRLTLKGYATWDNAKEDNYQRLFSPAQYHANNSSDELTDTWTGVPWVDQLYRKAWSTLRTNEFAYLKADFQATDSLHVKAGAYWHHNQGRGDWVPPYVLDVTNDNGGPQTEITGGPQANGGPILGYILFTDPAGNSLAPAAGCQSSITFPYGGASAAFDPACYPADAVAQQSYRHTVYQKNRTGLTADVDWTTEIAGMPNVLRGGVWYEDYKRDEYRDWHKITDTTRGFGYDSTAYWRQYDRSYPATTFKWYAEDTLTMGPVDLTLGAKQFLVGLKATDHFGVDPSVNVNSDSDVLYSGGAVYRTQVPGLELFAGYSENFKALSDNVLERPSSNLNGLTPETAKNTDVGVRYAGDMVTLSATYYDIKFDNRIIFIDNQVSTGPNYVIGTNGSYFNAGGIKSHGVEVSGLFEPVQNLSLYVAVSRNSSSYVGTGDPAVDAAVGITPGNDVVGVPQTQVVASVDYTTGPLTFGTSTKYTDSRAIRFDNSWRASSYYLTSAHVSLSGEDFSGMGGVGETLRNTTLNLTASNLFNHHYLGGISANGAWIGAPRSVMLSATVRF